MKTFAAVTLFATAVQASLILGPEHAAAPPAYTTTAGSPQAAATDGTNSLVLWGAWSSALRAAVVAPDGTLTPTPARVILRGAFANVSMVWTGDSYLVTGTAEAVGGVFVERLSRAGELIDGPRRILTASGTGAAPGALAWNGRTALLLYQRGSNPLAFAILDGRGEVLKEDIPVPTQLAALAYATAGDATGFVICWTPGAQVIINSPAPPIGPPPDAQVLAIRLSDSGEYLDSAPKGITTVKGGAGLSVNMTSDGQRAALVFVDRGTSSVARFVIGPGLNVEKMDDVPASATTYDAKVFWSGRRFIAYWASDTMNSFDLFSAPFDSAQPAPLIHGPRTGVNVSIVSNGASAIVLWADYRVSPDQTNSVSATFGAVLDGDAARVLVGAPSGMPMSIAAVPESTSSFAAADDSMLVVWIEKTGVATTLVGAMLDAHGIPVDPQPSVIAADVNQAAVITLGGMYLVVWSGSDRVVYGRRIARDGTAVDPAPVKYASGGSFAAASNGTTGIVATSSGTTISVVHVDATGSPSGSVVLAPRSSYDLAAACNSSECLVTWTEGTTYWQAPMQWLDIYGARVDANGTPMDAAPIAIATGAAWEYGAAVASDGRDFLVVYTASAGGQAVPATRISAKRVLSEGVLADTTADADGMLVVPAGGTSLCLRRNGRGYAFSWETSSGRDPSVASFALLDSRGSVVDRLDGIASSPSGYLQPALVVTPFGIVVSYSRLATEPQYSDVVRVFIRRIVPVIASRQRSVGR